MQRSLRDEEDGEGDADPVTRSDNADGVAKFQALVASIKRIVAHFSHSPLRTGRLMKAQKKAIAARDGTDPVAATTSAPWNRPVTKPLKLVKHNATRWNSKARMLIRFCRLYKFVVKVFSKSSTRGLFADDILDLLPSEDDIEQLKLALPAIYEIMRVTDSLQADNEPTLGQILPSFGVLRVKLTVREGDSAMTRAVKNALWTDIRSRFLANAQRCVLPGGSTTQFLVPCFCAATLLTPRFRNACAEQINLGSEFFDRESGLKAIEGIVASFCTTDSCAVPGCSRVSSGAADDMSDDEGEAANPSACHSDLFGALPGLRRRARSPMTVHAMFAIEWSTYEREEFPGSCKVSKNATWSSKWWCAHRSKFPHIAVAARRLLCVPATSAAAERMFSCAGLISTPLRNRLRAETLEKLTLLSCNKPEEWKWDEAV